MDVGYKNNKCFWLLAIGIFFGCSGSRYTKDYEVRSIETKTDFDQPEPVTSGTDSSFAPELSPNGEYIVYSSDRKISKDLWEKPTRGGFSRQLTTHSADDFSPAISPDGKYIAFVSRRTDALGDITVISSTGSVSIIGSADQSSVTYAHPKFEDTAPVWQSDSQSILFSGREPGHTTATLFHVKLGTQDVQDFHGIKGEQPTISSDGKFIAYSRNGAIYLWKDQTEFKLTSGSVGVDSQPGFSPDGTSVIFSRIIDDTNNDEVLSTDDHPTLWSLSIKSQLDNGGAETLEIKPITSPRYSAYRPKWRPPYVYFALEGNENLDIFRLAETGHLGQIAPLEKLESAFEQLNNFDDRSYFLRKTASEYYALKDHEAAIEASLSEIQWYIQNHRAYDAYATAQRLKNTFKNHPDAANLADVALLELSVELLGYRKELPSFLISNPETIQKNIETLISESPSLTARARGTAMLVLAKTHTLTGSYVAANSMAQALIASFPDNDRLIAKAEYFTATITKYLVDNNAAISAHLQFLRKNKKQRILSISSVNDVLAAAKSDNTDEYLAKLIELRESTADIPLLAGFAHLQIAKIYLDRNQDLIAMNEYRQISQRYVESPEVALEAAKAVASLGYKNERNEFVEDALRELYTSASTKDPTYATQAKELLITHYLHRGEEYTRSKELALAVKEYRKATKIEPMDVSAHRGIIDAMFARKRLADIEDEYRTMSADPDSAAKQYLWGYYLTYSIDTAADTKEKLKRIDESIQIIENARTLDAQILQIHQTLGWLYQQKSIWTEKYISDNTIGSKISKKVGLVRDFFGVGQLNWQELAIDSYLTAHFLSQPNSLERANLTLNLGNAYYELKNYPKSLSFYMHRLNIIKAIPVRDPKTEATIWRQAGRSAFMAEELPLAEQLQTQALRQWETLNSEQDIAYSLDALALTLREQNKYPEAIKNYERLLDIHQNRKDKQNIVNTKINLGYSYFSIENFPSSLEFFESAEKDLNEGAAAGLENEKSDSIQVDLAGQASSAKGFDEYNFRNLIFSFRSKIYLKIERPELALIQFKNKVELLSARRNKFKDDEQVQAERAVIEELAITQNNIGFTERKVGAVVASTQSFYEAYLLAKNLRPENQVLPTRDEWLNFANYLRSKLEVHHETPLNDKEYLNVINELKSIYDPLKSAHAEGKPVDSEALAKLSILYEQLLSLSKSSEKISDDAQIVSLSEESLQPVLNKPDLKLAALTLKPAFADLTEPSSVGLPAQYQWKYYLRLGFYKNALQSFVDNSNENLLLRSSYDDFLIQTAFDKVLKDSKSGDETQNFNHFRKFALAYTNQQLLKLRQFPDIQADKQDQSQKFVDNLQTLIPKDTVLLGLYVGKENQALAAMLDSQNTIGKLFELSAKDAKRPNKFIASQDLVQNAIKNYKKVFIIALGSIDPAAILDEIPAQNGLEISFLPSFETYVLAQNADNFIQLNIGEISTEPSGESLVRLQNPEKEYRAIDKIQPDTQLDSLNIIHVSDSLFTPARAPDYSFTRNDKRPQNRAGGFGIKEFFRHSFSENSLLLFQSRRHLLEKDLSANILSSPEYSIGTWAIYSGIPSTVFINTEKNSEKPVREIYSSLNDKSVGEIANQMRSKILLFGFPGLNKTEKIQIAKTQFSDVLAKADAAFESQNWLEATKLYRKAVFYSGLLEQRENLISTTEKLVKCLFVQRQFQSALFYQDSYIKLTANNDDPEKSVSALLAAVTVAVRSKEAEKALQYLDQAEKVSKQLEDNQIFANIAYYRAIALLSSYKYKEAIDQFLESRKFLQADEDTSNAAKRLLDIANVYKDNLNQPDTALEYYEKALTEIVESEDENTVLAIRVDRANLLIDRGQTKDAIDELESITKKIPKEEHRLLVQSNQILSNAYFRAAQYQQAIETNDRLLQILNDIEQPESQAVAYIDAMNLRGLINARLNKNDEARKSFELALERASNHGLEGKIALVNSNIGFFLRESGSARESLEYFQIALDIDKKLNAKSSIGFDYRNLALSVILIGDYSRAETLLNDALKLSSETGSIYNYTYSLMAKADLKLKQNRIDEAEKLFNEALETAKKAYFKDFIWKTYAALGSIKYKQKRLADAAKFFNQSIEVLESLRAGLQSASTRSGFSSDKSVQSVYMDYINVLMDSDEVEKAWAISERARARAFLDSIASQEFYSKNPEVATLIKNLKDKRSETEQVERKLANTTSAEELKKLEADLNMLRTNQAALVDEIRTKDPKMTQMVVVETITLDELRADLSADTALVEYMVTDDRIIIWVINKNEIIAKTVPVKAGTLAKSIDEFRVLLQNYSAMDFISKSLSNDLLLPIASEIKNAKKLAIVPHSALHFLSFAALPFESGYLLDKFSISYLESATILRYLKKPTTKPDQPMNVLALGNPTLGKALNLPFAEKEAHAIGRYFKNIKLALGDNATETFLVQNASNYRIIHIASHGEFNDKAPAESLLKLKADNFNDGNFTVQDVFNLKLDADLVTLSACETGLGKLSSGDEVVGLNRAFFYAGSKALISSLWRISDVASAIAIKRFYRNLSENNDKAESMRKAQLLVRDYYKHPAYWSAFRVLGRVD